MLLKQANLLERLGAIQDQEGVTRNFRDPSAAEKGNHLEAFSPG